MYPAERPGISFWCSQTRWQKLQTLSINITVSETITCKFIIFNLRNEYTDSRLGASEFSHNIQDKLCYKTAWNTLDFGFLRITRFPVFYMPTLPEAVVHQETTLKARLHQGMMRAYDHESCASDSSCLSLMKEDTHKRTK